MLIAPSQPGTVGGQMAQFAARDACSLVPYSLVPCLRVYDPRFSALFSSASRPAFTSAYSAAEIVPESFSLSRLNNSSFRMFRIVALPVATGAAYAAGFPVEGLAEAAKACCGLASNAASGADRGTPAVASPDCLRRDRKSTRLNSSHLCISYA